MCRTHTQEYLMSEHSQECQDHAFLVHATTGDDAECICNPKLVEKPTGEEISQMAPSSAQWYMGYAKMMNSIQFSDQHSRVR